MINSKKIAVVFTGAIAGLLVGLFIAPYLVRRPRKSLNSKFVKILGKSADARLEAMLTNANTPTRNSTGGSDLDD